MMNFKRLNILQSNLLISIIGVVMIASTASLLLYFLQDDQEEDMTLQKLSMQYENIEYELSARGERVRQLIDQNSILTELLQNFTKEIDK